MTIPKYINCKNKEFLVCDYFMDKSCPETCFYSHNIRGVSLKQVEDSKLVDKIKGEKVE